MYLFQCIPIFIPCSFFHKLDGIILDFIWDNKTPKLRLQSLQRAKEGWGVAPPKMLFYYWAVNIRNPNFWIQYENLEAPPMWLTIDANSTHPVTLQSLLHSQLSSVLFKYTNNTIVASSLKIWVQFHCYFGFQSLSTKSPLIGNHLFIPSLMNNAFSIWAQLGVRCIRDLFIDGVFTSFQQLVSKFSLPKNHFFRYLQVRSFISKTYACFPALPPDSDIENIMNALSSFKGAVSSIYSNIHGLRSDSLGAYRTTWETSLGMEILENMWAEALCQVHKSICAKDCFIQCKVLHHAH